MIIGGAEDKLPQASHPQGVRGRQRRARRRGSRSSRPRRASATRSSSCTTRCSAPMGAAEVTTCGPRAARRRTTPTWSRVLEKATGVFMTGGNQLKLSAIVCGTPARRRRSSRAHERGAVVAGTSAGRQRSSPATWSPSASAAATPKQRMTQMAAGLGLLPQHGHRPALRAAQPLRPAADDRRRSRRSCSGIGVDEDTAAVIVADGRRAARDRPRRGHDPRPAALSHERLRGQARPRRCWSAGWSLHVAPAGAALRPGDARLLPFEAVRVDRQRGAPSSSRGRAPTCARWRATSPPATLAERSLRRRLRAARGRSRTDPDPPATTATRTERRMTERPTPDLTILETRVYRGPNVWSYEPAIHLVVDLGVARAVPDQHDPRLHRRPARDAARPARALLLARPRAAASSSGCTRAPGSATSPSTSRWRSQQVVGHDIRPRQDAAGRRASRAATTWSSATSTSRSGWPPRRLAVRLVNHLVQADPEFDLDAELEAFILRAERTAFGPSTQAILDEAVSRDIPWIRLNQYSLVQLGQGVHAEADPRHHDRRRPRAIAVDIASDKDLTTRLLGAAGPPGAEAGVGAHRRTRPSAAAERIGYPVVVKPLDGNHGRGVCLDLQDEDDVRGGLPDRRGAVAARRGRRGVADRRQGLPLPGHRRPDRRDRRAGPGLGHRRRRPHGRAARRR